MESTNTEKQSFLASIAAHVTCTQCHVTTYNDSSVLFILDKSVVKPYKLVVFSNGRKVCLLEDLQCGLRREMKTHALILV